MKKIIPGQMPAAAFTADIYKPSFKRHYSWALFSFLLCWLMAGATLNITAKPHVKEYPGNTSPKIFDEPSNITLKPKGQKSGKNKAWFTQVNITGFFAPNRSATANLGDLVTLSYTANAPLPTNIITIAGHTVTPVLVNSFMGTDFYSASYKMWGTDVAGNVSFSVDVIDNNNQEIKFNNQGTLPPFYPAVNFINPPLTLDVGAFSSTYIPNNNLAHIGDRISLSWQTNYAVQSQNIVIAGHSPDQVQNVFTNTYQAFYSMLATDTVTKIRFEVDITDVWGHTASATMSRFGISYITFNTAPVVTVTGALTALSTTFGTASASSSVAIAGYNLTNGLLVTAPAGFEVSADNVNFAASVTVPAYASYLLHDAAVYVRLAASTPAGTYSGDVVLSASGLTDVHVPTVSSIVNPAATITSISAAGANPSNSTTVNYSIKLTDAVSGLTASNFSLTTTGISGASITSVTGSGDTYTAAVNTGTGNGTLTLSMINGTGLTLSITNALPFIGDTYTIDKSAPGLTSLQLSSNNSNNAVAAAGNTVTLTFTASESIQTPAVTIGGHNISVAGTGGNSYSASYVISNSDPIGRIHFSLNISDLAGNTASFNDVTAGDDIELVNADATLSGLSTSPGTLSPIFAAGVTAYTDTVSNSITTVAVTAVPNYPLATVSMLTNGNQLTNGASANVTVNPGNNNIVITITAQDGVTQSTYTLSLFRQPGLPVLTTSAVGNISSNTAFFGYHVTSTGGATLTDQGIVYSTTNTSPTTADTKISFGGQTGNFLKLISGLQAGTTYYVRAYATNATGTAYGGQVNFTTLNGLNAVTAASSNLTNAASVNYTVTFASGVTGLSAANFTVTATGGVTGAVVTSVSGSGAVYTVSVNTGTGDGTLTLNLDNATGLSDVATTLPFAGDTYTIDKTPPGISLSSPSLSSTVNGPVSYTVSYSDANFNAATLTASNISLNATGTATGTVGVTGSGSLYTVTIANISGGGTLGISVAAGTAADDAGNLAPAAGPSALFTVVSNDATLSGITLSKGALTPAFSAANTSYTVTLPNTANSITLTPLTNDPNATVSTTYNGSAASWPAVLVIGSNIFTTTVTAQDGTTKTYTITVTRGQSINSYLAAINPSVGHISPTFTQTNTAYTLSVSNATATITVKPVSTDASAIIKVNGSPVISGSVSDLIPLAAGTQTPIDIVVRAANGSTRTYTVAVTRAPSANAGLSALQLNAGVLKQPFSPGNISYTANVPNVTSSIIITPTTADPAAIVSVNNAPATSGTGFGPIALSVGSNTISIKVTAADGSTTKTYTLTITRSPSINDNLASMGQGIGPLTPVFAQGTTSYALSVNAATSLMTIKPVSAEPNAKITVNGAPATSGVTFGPILLAEGPNTINVKVTAQDGVTNKTYTIIVTRPASSLDSYNPGISVTKPTETPVLAADGIIIHQGISPNGDGQNDFLQIDNISQYPENKLSIMNRNGQLVYEANGYDNSSKAFDGHSNKNGQMQLPGTYFYQLDYTVNGVVKHRTGFLVLKY